MNITLRVFLIVLIIFQLCLIIYKAKQKGLTMRYASLWMLFLLILIIIVIFPNIIIKLAKLCGFEASSNMIFLLGFFSLYYISFISSISISKQNEKIKTLIQEISMLKKKVEEKDERK